jgi:glucose/arabinose dehydrogenase
MSVSIVTVAMALAIASCGDAIETPLGVSDTVAADGGETTTSSATPDTEPDDAGDVPDATDATATTGNGQSTDTTAADAGTDATQPSSPLQGLALEFVAGGFHQPTGVVSPVGDERLFVVERQGVIRLIDAGGNLAEDPFLDLRDRVGSNGIEQGLLGLAFHPDFATNGRLFVYHTDTSGNRQLAEYVATDDPSRADADSEKVLFELSQPAESTDIRHYAGNIHFGPDGYLYVSLGDGADGRNQGQNPDSMFASIVRLDVDGGDPYAIPADNPFVDGGGAPEVWAYGLRNPWRFSIDHEERMIYIADVGQSNWEEVNVVSLDDGGVNFGWFTTEGNHCYSSSECDMTGITLPVIEYDHEDGCSITGGFVYRGSQIPEIAGHYFYGDWCGLWVRSFRFDGTSATEEQDWSADLVEAGQVNTFGVDGFGEMYLANFEGDVYRIVPER